MNLIVKNVKIIAIKLYGLISFFVKKIIPFLFTFVLGWLIIQGIFSLFPDFSLKIYHKFIDFLGGKVLDKTTQSPPLFNAMLGVAFTLIEEYFIGIIKNLVTFIWVNRAIIFGQKEYEYISLDSLEPIRKGFMSIKESEITRLIDVFSSFKGNGIGRVDIQHRNGLSLSEYLDIVRISLLKGGRKLYATWDNRTLNFAGEFYQAKNYLNETIKVTAIRIFIDEVSNYQKLKTTKEFYDFIQMHEDQKVTLYFIDTTCLQTLTLLHSDFKNLKSYEFGVVVENGKPLYTLGIAPLDSNTLFYLEWGNQPNYYFNVINHINGHLQQVQTKHPSCGCEVLVSND